MSPPPTFIHGQNVLITGGHFQQKFNDDSERGEQSRIKRMIALYV